MARKKKGELPSGNIRRQVYDHSEPVYDKNGKPVIDPKTGKQKVKRIYTSITASSSQEADLLKAELKAGKRKPSYASKMTLYDAIDKYIESSDALLSPSTIRGYRIMQRNSFPSIMNLPLNQITTERLREAVNAECKRPVMYKNRTLSPKTVKNRFGLLTAVLNMYAPNIDYNVKLPQQQKNQNELSKPDVIYNLVKGTPIELPVLLAMWLSLTESEIVGLTKSESLSADGEYIKIKNVVVLDEHHRPVLKEKGKQPARERTHKLPAYIKELIDRVETDRIVPLSGTAIYRRFRTIIKNSDIPYMTFHDLRHVNASVMHLLKVPDKYAQERGGWSSDHVMKGTYTQTFSDERIIVDSQIDNYFQNMLFGTTMSQKEEEKYKCWRTLFDMEDTDDSKKQFYKFCSENSIKL